MTTNEATPSDKTENAPAALAEGQKLAGCYVLKKRVGVGITGELWQSHDEVLGKDISLQFIPEAVRKNAKAVADVRQEIKRNRQLIHPNILRVYDFIEEPDWAAVSMDTFEGESLESIIAKKASRIFSAGEIEPWILQLCQTLDDAHKIGLFHRDISPPNIYFRSGGGVFLTGFGFSRCIRDSIPGANGPHGSASAELSPQLLDGQPATRTDDIYACGALLFELLTGAPVFSGDDLAEKIRHSAPKAINELRPKNLEPVPENWVKAIAACLSKNPVERPASGGSLAKLLTSTANAESPAAASGVLPAVAAAVVAESKEVKDVKGSVTQNETRPETPASGLSKRTISTTAEPLFSSTTPSPKPGVDKPSTAEPAAASKAAKTANAAKSKPIKPDPYPSLYENRSHFPALGFAVAVALIVVGVLGYHFMGPQKKDDGYGDSKPADQSANTGSQPSENTSATGPTVEPGNGKSVDNPPETNGKLNPSEVAVKPQVAGGSAPVTTPKPASSGAPSSNPVEKTLAEKQAVLEVAKQAVASADKSVADLTAQQQKAEADAVAAQKALDGKMKALTPAKNAVAEILAKRKKLEDDQKAAELAAQQAQQAADDKQRLAAAAKQAVDDLTSKNQDKFTDADKTEAEIADFKKTLEDKQQAASLAAKAITDAQAARQKQTDAVKLAEQEVDKAKAAVADIVKNRAAKEEKKKKLDDELVELRKMMDEKLRSIEEERKRLDSGESSPDAVAPSPNNAAPSLNPSTPPPATPAPAATPAKSTTKPVATPTRATPVASAIPALPPGLEPLPKPAPTPSAELAKLTKPDGPAVDLGNAPGEVVPIVAGGNVNSLGQKFVTVGDVDFCIWTTRVKDFEAFANAVNLKSTGWRNPGFKQGLDHPVVNVTWHEAIAFCKWLTDKEHSDGVLPASRFYRLPTDLEWSKAVGLPEEPGRTPADRDMVIADVYPWGKDWPPPAGAGNYTGEETASDVAIKGYNDGFPWTSPVGSFKPNKYGLYDMGGNVWQWCMDSWDAVSKGKVLRGASWYNGALKLSLLSSCRVHASPDSPTDNYGFRIVKAAETSHSPKK